MSVADVMAYEGFFAANFTYFRHDDFSLSEIERILLYHQKMNVKGFFYFCDCFLN